MNVAYMLDLMGTLGVGEGSPSNPPTETYLKYLNLANLELYRRTCAFNSDILLYEIPTNETNNVINDPPNFIETIETPFIVTEVLPFNQTTPLKGLSVPKYVLEVWKNSSLSGDPKIYSRKKKQINFFPYTPATIYQFIVLYAPQPNVLDENTDEDSIPYPIAYHDVLVNGALYYLFADEAGFRSAAKEDKAEERWKSGKSELISYLVGSNSEKVSTFRNV